MKFTQRFKNAFSAFRGRVKETGTWRSLGSLFGGYSQAKSREYLAEYKDWVYGNVNKISMVVSSMNIRLMQVKGEDVEEVKEDNFLDLLYRPNPYSTKDDFLKLLTTYLLTNGEGPIRLKRKNPLSANELPTEMWLLKPQDVVVKVGKTADLFRVLTGYEISDEDGAHKSLNPWEMVFINNQNPDNMFRGIGVIEAAARTIDRINYAEDYNTNFFKNGGVPDAAFYTEQILSDESYKRLENDLNSRYNGVENAHKTMILEAGLKIEKLQNTAKDMDFVEQLKYDRDKLMSLMGTTKAIMGIVEDVNRANAEASEYIFMKYTAKPIMQQIINYLNEFLLPVFNPKGDMFLTFDDPIPDDTALKTDKMDRLTNKVYTVNESRQMEKLPPVDGGDVIYLPYSLAPMGEGISGSSDNSGNAGKMMELKVIKAKGIDKYRDQVIRLKNRNLRRKKLIESVKKELKKILSKNIKNEFKGPKYKNVKHKATIDLYVKEVRSKATGFEGQFKTKVAEYYGKQKLAVLKKLNGSKAIKAAEDYLFNKTESIKVGIDLTTPVIEALILDQGQEAYDLLGVEKPYSMLTEARRYLKKEPVKYAKSMTNTAYDKIRGSLAEGLKNGESVPELVKRVNEIYDGFTKDHAENIAITEVSRATNFAQLDAYEQSGVVEGKEWVVTEDDRLCEFCMALEQDYNSKLDLKDSFFKKGDTVSGIEGGTMTLDYDDIDAPPLHNQCRCVTIPVLEPIKAIEPPKTKEKTEEEIKDEAIKEIEKEIGLNGLHTRTIKEDKTS